MDVSTALFIATLAFLVGVGITIIVSHIRAARRRAAYVAGHQHFWSTVSPRERQVFDMMTQTQDLLRDIAAQAREHSLRIERLQMEAEVRGRRGQPRESERAEGT